MSHRSIYFYIFARTNPSVFTDVKQCTDKQVHLKLERTRKHVYTYHHAVILVVSSQVETQHTYTNTSSTICSPAKLVTTL